MGLLSGRVAIVTGAGNGLGRSHAMLLGSEGARVVVNDAGPSAAEVAAEITAAGGTAIADHSDVTDWAAVETLVDRTIDQFGYLDIVVNNAGITRDSMVFSLTEELYDSVVDVHLKGHVALVARAARHWRSRAKATPDDATPRSARIINTTSESGLFGGASQSNYGAAKGGIITLTRIWAKELGRYGVTTNCIAPRARTAMTEGAERFAKPDDGFDPYDPAHVSPMVAWLASDDAHDVNGQTFIVTGDEIHLMSQPKVAASIMAGDKRWTPEEINSNRANLFHSQSSQIPQWGGPALR